MTEVSHFRTVKTYGVPGKCVIRVGDWPYECKRKDQAGPDDIPVMCETHGVWWVETRNYVNELAARASGAR